MSKILVKHHMYTQEGTANCQQAPGGSSPPPPALLLPTHSHIAISIISLAY